MLGRLGDMLERMHRITRETFGKLGEESLQPPSSSCHSLVLENARKQLEYAARHLAPLARREERLAAALEETYAAIGPRDRFGFIHGELGPDHVLVNGRLEPMMIDIEGAEFCDIEHEHSFLQFRFGEFYRYLERPGLDPERMRFYKLAHHLSCASGGIKLLQRGFPNRKLASHIAHHNARSALRFLEK
ncbi:phosphotransferase [Paenibacillus humicola]|uniref:phosphotransferase n=1 Tax=Paenibacillus humicola TaxID=3110540 RepID=UPI00237B6BF0|nr:phosphotransferase [Paenibacillus humicola]